MLSKPSKLMPSVVVASQSSSNCHSASKQPTAAVQDLSLQRLRQHLLASSLGDSFWHSTAWLAMLGNTAMLVADGAVQVRQVRPVAIAACAGSAPCLAIL